VGHRQSHGPGRGDHDRHQARIDARAGRGLATALQQDRAEVTYDNIKKVGLPKWDDADQTLARAVQKEIGVEPRGLATELDELTGPIRDEDNRGGGSDDIGDVSWAVPTVTLRYPSNIPNLPGHNWVNGIAMATPIATRARPPARRSRR